MLEVLFSDSAAGSLKASLGRHDVIGESECCTIGIIATDEDGKPLPPEETERLRQKELEKNAAQLGRSGAYGRQPERRFALFSGVEHGAH